RGESPEVELGVEPRQQVGRNEVLDDHPAISIDGAADRRQVIRPLQAVRQKISSSPAAPWPPPMHIVTTPYLAPRRLPSWRMWPVQRAPVMPNGWPMEIDPPFTLYFSGSIPSRSREY